MKKVAVIGGGIAGLGAAWLLRNNFDVTLFERGHYPGGHSNTVDINEEGRLLPVDTGFMVFNKVTYPNLTRLFTQLGVPIKPTTMSFSVQHCASGLEYNGAGINLLFGQRRNILNPRFWALLNQIGRFNKEAPSLVEKEEATGITLAELAEKYSYGKDFLDLYLVPMGASVWSTPPDQMLEFPAETLMRFWKNHGFLGLNTHFQWWTVEGGSREYVKILTAPLKGRIRLDTPVRSVSRKPDGVAITLLDGSVEKFDKAIFACHADEALGLLADPTPTEQELLSPFGYQENLATLHSDPQFMPRTKRCWASWNYRVAKPENGPALPTVHYWMNSLQGVSKTTNYFVSLNVQDQIPPGRIVKTIKYTHPVFTLEAIKAQKSLPALNRVSESQSTYFCGSYFRYGFHEDAFTAGLECAEALAGKPLWK
jgi:uncharacterized protein